MSDKAESSRVSFQIGDHALWTPPWAKFAREVEIIGLDPDVFWVKDDVGVISALANELAPLAASPETQK